MTTYPQVDSHLATKQYDDESISKKLDKLSLLRLDSKEKLELDKQDSKIPISTLTTPKTVNEIPTKANIHTLPDENEKILTWFRVRFS